MMQHIAHAITATTPTSPDGAAGGRAPEEVTEMQRTVKGEIIASTFDAGLQRATRTWPRW